MSTSPIPAPADVVTVLPAGRTVFGMQLPVQSQSTLYAQPWESEAGADELAAVALACEAAGFFYVGVCDHTFIPERLAGAMSTVWYDTVATLGWLAGITSEIRLLSHIYVIALRHPLRAAKEFATLDALSHGRVICGVGAGHVTEEFDQMGPEFDHRGPATDEAIAGLAAGLVDEYPVLAGPGGGVRPRAPAPPGAVAASADLGRRFVTGRAPPGRPVRRRLAAAVAGAERGAAGRVGHARASSTGAVPPSTSGGSRTASSSAPHRPASSSPGTVAGPAEQVADYLRTFSRGRVGQVQVRFPSRRSGSCATRSPPRERGRPARRRVVDG